jgi:hypothetical protein
MADLTSNQVCNICCVHYNAGIRCCALGSLVEGGYLYAKHGSVGWIVACASREVSRTWTSIADAVTVAQASNACGDWFIPSRTDLQYANDCKSFWDSFSSTGYWSSTELNATYAWGVYFEAGLVYNFTKTSVCCVRAIRRVFY